MFKIENLHGNLIETTKSQRVDDLVRLSTTDGSNKFCILPRKFVEKDLDRIKNMEIFDDDIWIITFPKCGTTWTQEMIWMLSNNLDYETSMKVELDERFPFIELGSVIKEFSGDSFEMAVNTPRPRHIKSHLPPFLLPDQLWTVNPKIIYVVRNPKDAAVSFYHHHCNLFLSNSSMTNYIRAFAQDLILFSPMNDHVKEFWKLHNESNILFLFFEDMKRNLESEVKKVMKFLGKSYSQEQIDKLCGHLSFESLQKNVMVNQQGVIEMVKNVDKQKPGDYKFIRKGIVGGYQKELNSEENDLMDKYLKSSGLKELGFEYKFS